MKKIKVIEEIDDKYFIGECFRHGQTKYIRTSGNTRVRCVQCRCDAVSKRRKKVKSMLIAAFGGGCCLCGYDRCERALEFHHLDPNEKDFGLSAKGHTRSFKKALEEAKKCVLICSRCHVEVEDGLITKDLTKYLIK